MKEKSNAAECHQVIRIPLACGVLRKKGRGETDEDMHPSQLQKYYILVTLRKYYISKKKKTSVLQKYFHYISIKKNAEKKGKWSIGF